MYANEILKNASETDFIFALSSFLDDFYRSENKASLISEEPDNITGFETQAGIIAAVVHKLANENKLLVPTWVFDKRYILKKPYYQFYTENEEYRKYLFEKSPSEFKQRNIYVDENAIVRI